MAEVIDAAAMGEAVNEQRTVVGLHHLGLTAAVVRPFQWIGQSFTDKAASVCQDGMNCDHAEVVEVQLEIWEQHAAMPR